MDRTELIEKIRIIRAASEDPVRRETLGRLAEALEVPVSFRELEPELPPALRYLGPGAWITAIRDARNIEGVPRKRQPGAGPRTGPCPEGM